MGACSSCFSSANADTVKYGQGESTRGRALRPSPAKASSPHLTDADFTDWKGVGEGAYGDVFSAVHKHTGEVLAIKKIKKRELDRYVRDECLNLAKCNHSQIITYKDAYMTEEHLCVVMELAEGDLHSYLRDMRHLPEGQARWLFQQIICAVDYCHRFEIAHRDLKLENTLLVLKGPKPLIKICDFGVAKEGNISAMVTRGVGTVGYIAPEVLVSGPNLTYDGSKADVWSAGVILYILVLGQHPFVTNEDVERQNFTAANKRSLNADYSFPKGAILSSGYMCLLRRMLQPDVRMRISLDEVFEDPWFTKELPEGAKSRDYRTHPDFPAREAHLMSLLGPILRANEERRPGSGRMR